MCPTAGLTFRTEPDQFPWNLGSRAWIAKQLVFASESEWLSERSARSSYLNSAHARFVCAVSVRKNHSCACWSFPECNRRAHPDAGARIPNRLFLSADTRNEDYLEDADTDLSSGAASINEECETGNKRFRTLKLVSKCSADSNECTEPGSM